MPLETLIIIPFPTVPGSTGARVRGLVRGTGGRGGLGRGGWELDLGPGAWDLGRGGRALGRGTGGLRLETHGNGRD